MNVKLLTEHYLEFLSLKGGCTGSSVACGFSSIKIDYPKSLISRINDVYVFINKTSLYEGCSNMNASSFITFFTCTLRQKAIPFWKELFVALTMAPNIKKHSLYFSSYRRLYKGQSCILKIFWSILQYTFWYMCAYNVISL